MKPDKINDSSKGDVNSAPLTLAQVALISEKSLATVKRWRTLGWLEDSPATGTDVQITRESFDRLLSSGKLRQSAQSPSPNVEPGELPRPGTLLRANSAAVEEPPIQEPAREKATNPERESLGAPKAEDHPQKKGKRGRKMSSLRRAKRFLRNYPKSELVKLAEWLPGRIAAPVAEGRTDRSENVDLHASATELSGARDGVKREETL
jgi:hypothetical protein